VFGKLNRSITFCQNASHDQCPYRFVILAVTSMDTFVNVRVNLKYNMVQVDEVILYTRFHQRISNWKRGLNVSSLMYLIYLIELICGNKTSSDEMEDSDLCTIEAP